MLSSLKDIAARKAIIGEVCAKYTNGARLKDLAEEYMQIIPQIRRWVRAEHTAMEESDDPFLALTEQQKKDWSRKREDNLIRGHSAAFKPLTQSDRLLAAEYNAGKISLRKLAKKHGLSLTNVRTILRKANTPEAK